MDDTITNLEGELSKVIDSFRAALFGAPVDAAVAARTVYHLVTRTAHIRSLLTNGFVRLLESIDALLADSDRRSAMVGLGSTALSPRVVNAIQSTVAKSVPFGVPEALSERLLAFHFREQGPRHLAETSATMREALAGVLPGIARQVREAHEAILAQDSAEHRWIERLAGFDWHVEHVDGLILPDAVGLASDGTGRLLPLLFTDGESIAVVTMPVASNRLLMGLRPGTAMIDLANFNTRAAACCENFFIAAKSMDALGLAASIGTEATGAIGAIVADALAKVGGGDLSVERRIAVLGGTAQNFSYSLQLDGFGDAALAEQLVEVLNGVVSVLARRLPLGSLDGFTLAADYPAALAGLDRGGALPPEMTTALGYGLGVAKTVEVVRNGDCKAHVVLASGVALSWLSADPAIRAESLSILVKMLAYVAHDYGYYDQLAAASLKPDPITLILHPAVAWAPRSWYSAREAAFVAPDIGGSYAELVLKALAFGREAMAAARARFSETQEIEPLVRTALECASAILAHAADWLGHRAGLAEDMYYAGSDLPQSLSAWELADWIELYGRDLAAIYETADGRLDVVRATCTSPHVERLLWVLGLLAWPEEDTVRWFPFDPGQAPVVVSDGAEGSGDGAGRKS